MDPTMMGISIFFLLALIIIGGFVLVFPLSRQLAKFLELRMKDKAGISEGAVLEVRQLRAVVEGLEGKLQSVADRQEFLEKVLEARDTNPRKLGS
jgi:hypothetical protein